MYRRLGYEQVHHARPFLLTNRVKALLDEAEGRGRPLRRLVRLVVDWAKQRLLCHDAQNKKHSRLITMKTVHWTLLVWAAVCGPLASQSSETVRDREFDWHSQ